MPAQGTAFAPTSHKGKGKKGSSRNTKYISDADWKAMSPKAQTKIINARKMVASEDEDDKSSASSKSAKSKDHEVNVKDNEVFRKGQP